MVGRAIVPDDNEWLSVLIPELPEKGRRTLRRAGVLDFHCLHLACLQAYRRTVAGFSPGRGLLESTKAGCPLAAPLPSEVTVGPEMGLIDKEDLGAAGSG